MLARASRFESSFSSPYAMESSLQPSTGGGPVLSPAPSEDKVTETTWFLTSRSVCREFEVTRTPLGFHTQPLVCLFHAQPVAPLRTLTAKSGSGADAYLLSDGRACHIAPHGPPDMLWTLQTHRARHGAQHLPRSSSLALSWVPASANAPHPICGSVSRPEPCVRL